MLSSGPPRILILGVGNADRGDDAVGLIVARRVRNELRDVAEVREVRGEGTALLELWTGADVVIVIDAIQSGSAPGTVHRFDASRQPIPASSVRSSTHAFGVAEAVALARTLQQLPPRLVVYGIEGKSFALGVGLSPEVERSVEELVTRVRQEVTRWYAGG